MMTIEQNIRIAYVSLTTLFLINFPAKSQLLTHSMFELGYTRLLIGYSYRANSLVDGSAEQTFDLTKAFPRNAWQNVFIGFNTDVKDIVRKVPCEEDEKVNKNRCLQREKIIQKKDTTIKKVKKQYLKTSVPEKSKLWTFASLIRNSARSDSLSFFNLAELVRYDSVAIAQLWIKHKRIKRTGETSDPSSFRILNYCFGFGFAEHQLPLSLRPDKDTSLTYKFKSLAFTLGLDYIPYLGTDKQMSWSLKSILSQSTTHRANSHENPPGGYLIGFRPQVRFFSIQDDSSLLAPHLGFRELLTFEWIVQPSLTIDFTIENFSIFFGFSRAWLLQDYHNDIKNIKFLDLTNRLDFKFGITGLIGLKPFKDPNRYNQLLRNS